MNRTSVCTLSFFVPTSFASDIQFVKGLQSGSGHFQDIPLHAELFYGCIWDSCMHYDATGTSVERLWNVLRSFRHPWPLLGRPWICPRPRYPWPPIRVPGQFLRTYLGHLHTPRKLWEHPDGKLLSSSGALLQSFRVYRCYQDLEGRHIEIICSFCRCSSGCCSHSFALCNVRWLFFLC